MEFNSKEELVRALQGGLAGRKFACDGFGAERALRHVIEHRDCTPGAEEQLIGVITHADGSNQIRLLNSDHLLRRAYRYADSVGGQVTLYGVTIAVFQAVVAREYYTPAAS